MNIFQNPTKTLPKSDPQIVRVDMTQSDIGARKDHMPPKQKAENMSISHVPSKG